MNELTTITNEEQRVSARALHEQLNIGTEFRKWFPRMAEYGFTENEDYKRVSQKCPTLGGEQEMVDYEISMDMAKQICMIQRTPEGKKVRQYLIDLEKAWNTPELIMARALKVANQQIATLTEKNEMLLHDNQRMKPKEIFADAVSASDSSILIRDLAKIIKQNGYPIGEKRFYKWLRENGYIIKGTCQPTQKAMERGLFEIIERTVQRADLPPMVTVTTKVTGKGQQYFINKFLG